MGVLKIAMAQINPIVGDFSYNIKRILEYTKQAKELGAQVAVFPEMSICGYPPEDLLLKKAFLDDSKRALGVLMENAPDIKLIVGLPLLEGDRVFNGAAIVASGRLLGVHKKVHLPNYGVFDEMRYFCPGDAPRYYQLHGYPVSITICEDIWVPSGIVDQTLRTLRPKIIFNLSASPFHKGKVEERLLQVSRIQKLSGAHVVYVNQVGGQDELVFDGGSFILPYGRGQGVRSYGIPRFKEGLLVAGLEVDTGEIDTLIGDFEELGSESFYGGEAISEVYEALVLGIRDYVSKNGFKKAVLGVSGGIDSAVVLSMASRALGRENVTGVTMPSRYTSKETFQDALQLIGNLGVGHINVPIDPIFSSYLTVLVPQLGTNRGVAIENIQARIRGNILMALSNQFNWLVLTTGNKSEVATGYCTLYGDTAGGLAVIKDLPKHMVYGLARYINGQPGGPVIPSGILERPPTAELRPNQKDEDTLPPYDVLDPIVEAYVERDLSPEEIEATGLGHEHVLRAIRLIHQSEYKRRQSPPGIKITPKAFGRDRRLPVTNHYLTRWDGRL